MAILFSILRTGNDFSCSADGAPKYFVGRRVPYEGNIGLYNIFSGTRVERLNYSAADFQEPHRFWADFIEPTAVCEGRNFLTLNSYDRAAFTFGFGQFAAHVPNGDFVEYLRAMLQLPQAADYFPHLGVVNGRISKTDGAAPKALESDESTKPLMDYLNPGLSEVEDAEVIAAAKLIHWTSKHVSARNAQVLQMISTFRGIMREADRRVGVNGRTANECCVIADLRHHGRGGRMLWPLVEDALRSSNPFNALIAIGAPKWEERKRSLRNAIRARPVFLQKKWSRAAGDFV